MKRIATTLLIFFVSFCFGQNKDFSYEAIKHGESFSFPIFHNDNNLLATEKINQLLQISELRLLKGFEKENIFEDISVDDKSLYGRRFRIWDTILSDSKILSIKFEEGSCGVTCNYWTAYYNFNTGNGDLMQLSDLFVDSLYPVFHNYVTKKLNESVIRQFQKVDIDSSEKANWINSITTCFNENDKRFPFAQFYVKDGNLFIDNIGCFHKDILPHNYGETITEFNLSEFKPYLNDYGKAVFSMMSDSIGKFHSNQLPQLFEGTIGKEDVFMTLNLIGLESIQGEYVYQKYGHGVFIDGRKVDNWIEMDEYDSSGKKSGKIEATINGTEIKGSWSNADNTKTYPFFVKRR